MTSRITRTPIGARALRLALALALLLGLAGPLAPAARAATRTVTTLADSGAGSLRQAIADAVSEDTITFAVPGTIALTGGELVIDKALTISGPGANALTLSGNNASRVLYVPLGVPAGGGSVRISGLTIADGDGFSPNFGG